MKTEPMPTQTTYYTLDGHTPVPCDINEFGRLFEDQEKRRVASHNVDNVRISTVFLGLDHNWSGEGDPLLFETMVFGGRRDGALNRCSTWEQAELMHLAALSKVVLDAINGNGRYIKANSYVISALLPLMVYLGFYAETHWPWLLSLSALEWCLVWLSGRLNERSEAVGKVSDGYARQILTGERLVAYFAKKV